MKKKISVAVIVMVFLCISTANAGIKEWYSNIKSNISDYINHTLLDSIESESPDIWGIDSTGKKYIPRMGGIKVCKAENNLIVAFQMTQNNIDFYKQEFSSGKRKPMGFEIDVIDHSHVFDNSNEAGTSDNLPSGSRYKEEYMNDSGIIHTLAIGDPSKLEADKWYKTTFHYSKHNEVAIANFEVQVQLVGNIFSLKNDFLEKYEGYSTYTRGKLRLWFDIANFGNPSLGNSFFNIRVSESSMFDEDDFFGWPEGKDSGYDRVIWDFGKSNHTYDYQPYYCGFGNYPTVNLPKDPGPNPGDTPSNPGTDPGTGGGTNPPLPDDPEPPPDPTPDEKPDLHISSVKGGLASEDHDDMNNSITETLKAGQCIRVSFVARYTNESSQKAKDVDFDWRADQDRSRFDENDDKLCDENREDVAPHTKNKKTFNNAKLCVSNDGRKLTLTGPDGSITSEFKNSDGKKVAKIYVFGDVEEKGRSNGDHDISSEHGDEYTKIEITLKKPQPPPEPKNRDPRGSVDNVKCDNIYGWAKDPDTNQKIKVKVQYNEQIIATLTANNNGGYGFKWTVPDEFKDGRMRKFYFYAIDSSDSSIRRRLENGEVIFNCNQSQPSDPEIKNQPPRGLVEVSGPYLEGWAKDPDTDKPTIIRFYGDGPSGKGELFAEEKTFNNQYQFKHSLSSEYRCGAHKIWVYAVDAQDGSEHLLEGAPCDVNFMAIIMPIIWD